MRAEYPEDAAIHRQVLQDVLGRLDRTYQAFFRRIERGEGGKQAGFPRFQGRSGNRYRSFTSNE
jgi:putative transposase